MSRRLKWSSSQQSQNIAGVLTRAARPWRSGRSVTSVSAANAFKSYSIRLSCGPAPDHCHRHHHRAARFGAWFSRMGEQTSASCSPVATPTGAVRRHGHFPRPLRPVRGRGNPLPCGVILRDGCGRVSHHLPLNRDGIPLHRTVGFRDIIAVRALLRTPGQGLRPPWAG